MGGGASKTLSEQSNSMNEATYGGFGTGGHCIITGGGGGGKRPVINEKGQTKSEEEYSARKREEHEKW
jgi:hypothetical protein